MVEKEEWSKSVLCNTTVRFTSSSVLLYDLQKQADIFLYANNYVCFLISDAGPKFFKYVDNYLVN